MSLIALCAVRSLLVACTDTVGIITVAVDGEHTGLRNHLPRTSAVTSHYSFKLKDGAVNTQVPVAIVTLVFTLPVGLAFLAPLEGSA